MSTLRVNLAERSYDIAIGSGIAESIADYLQQWSPTSHVVLVTDETVDELHGDRLASHLTEAGLEVDVFAVPVGETSKSADLLIELWESLLDQGTDRGSVVVAVGGGVIGDLAGFVAATFTRGLRFIQVPTTLLAQVDSSVGGKVGINLTEAKNMVGAFWQPNGVLIDVDLLATLPPREFAAGMAEVIKYGVIMDAEFFEWIENNQSAIRDHDAEALAHIVEQSCRLKAQVVEADERETSGHRAILNFGHTFGHALEAATEYKSLLHGEAVAIGMVCAARLAFTLGRVDEGFCQRLEKLLAAFDLPTKIPLDIDRDAVLKLMWHDKKVADNRLVFVLPTQLGHVELVSNVDDNAVDDKAIVASLG